MYLHACKETGGMRHQAAAQPHMVAPQKVRYAVIPYRMQAGIAEKNLDRAPRRRILCKYGL
jgi:hypothetical protein